MALTTRPGTCLMKFLPESWCKTGLGMSRAPASPRRPRICNRRTKPWRWDHPSTAWNKQPNSCYPTAHTSHQAPHPKPVGSGRPRKPSTATATTTITSTDSSTVCPTTSLPSLMTSIIHAPNKVPLMNSMPHAGSHTGHSEKLPSTDSAYKHAREPDALQADAGAHLQGTPDAAGGHNQWPLKPTLACPQVFTRTSSATSTPPYTTNTGENHSEETGHTTTGTTHSTAGTSTHSRKWSDQSLTYPGRPSCAASTQYHRRHANMGQTCSLLSKTILIMAIFAGIIGPVTPQYGSASQTPSTPSYQSSGEVTTSVQDFPTTLRESSSPPTPPTSGSARLTTRETQRRQDGTNRAAYAICKSYRKGVAALDPSNLLHSVGIPLAFGMWPIPVTQLVMHAIKVPCDDIIRISEEEALSRHKRNIVNACMRLFGRLF